MTHGRRAVDLVSASCHASPVGFRKPSRRRKHPYGLPTAKMRSAPARREAPDGQRETRFEHDPLHSPPRIPRSITKMISAAELSALLQVIVVDLVLAGDNAIVVGLVAAGLPARDRTPGHRDRHRRRDPDAGRIRGGDGAVAPDRGTAAGRGTWCCCGWPGSCGARSGRGAKRTMYRQPRPGRAAAETGNRPGKSAKRSFKSSSPTCRCHSTTCSRSPVSRAITPGCWWSGWCSRWRSWVWRRHGFARQLEHRPWIAYVGLAVIFYVAMAMIVEGAQEVATVAGAA